MTQPFTADTPPIVTDDHRIAAALSELPTDVRRINEAYLRHVSKKSLICANQAQVYVGQTVTLFLRHDKIKVFALIFNEAETSTVGMADFVTLNDVVFHVNGIGRHQTVQERGPLPNRRTVHAFLTGRLASISDLGQIPSPDDWSPVCYNPMLCRKFYLPTDKRTVHTARTVLMTPGRTKVWVRADGTTNSIATPVAPHETGP
ncbi:MAG: hypothetical protein GY826_42260 [Fuerstiella sp.]|jgi:hypothetical protein|nr:hypothetical protein [Fuerstiella sp.]MDG2127556.1 hypothetical protein [Fuerstiella sp.]